MLGSGYDNDAFLVGDLVVRVAKVPDREKLGHEARLLTAVAAISPVPVPEVVFVDHEHGCLAYRKLPGTPLIDVPAVGPFVLDQLAEFIECTHTAEMAGLATVDNYSPAQWRDESVETYREIRDHVPVLHKPMVEAFLADSPPQPSPERVFAHNDLGIEHILVDGTKITGIIDWSDAELTDPAHDFAALYRDLGGPVVDRLLGKQAADVRARAVFYARCYALEDMAFALREGQPKYHEKALRALTWLF
ncbi:aminoglycoside phosphotransferase (APT) family kinase protein [Labedaea rhizosphaerae]|uniref:Aminoglycoside phosphotransferase (APT) family kinase protein n=1 Tax=Labedaea rhizosphaerae TaxID=598644 RepID=A0A4R6SJ97_LABRH|nr:aminoglycoside phosphotransferase (APT) family kinase protein [Labedaea rhizosphaerae]